MLRIDGEVAHAGAIENGKKQQQTGQAGNDTGKAHPVELAKVDLMEAAPSLERPGGDQETGDDEEDADTVIAAPEEYAIGSRTDEVAESAFAEVDPEVDMVQDDSDDAEPAE